MTRATILPLLILTISLLLLIPGITQPLITLQANMNRQAVVQEGQRILQQQDLHPAMKSMASQFLSSLRVEGESRVYGKTRSILGTAQDLWQFGYRFVAILILTFSVVIPVLKSLLLMVTAFSTQPRTLLTINSVISKWSMADVFAMGVIIAALAANGASSESVIINFQAELHSGFYWFVGYCLSASAGAQWLFYSVHQSQKNNP